MQEEVLTLSRIEDLEIRLYKLETKSHLRVGAGEGSMEVSAAENPIIRALITSETDPQGRRVPYIPASSLHGVIRSWVEKVLRSQAKPYNPAELRALIDEENEEAKGQARREFKELLGRELKDDELYKHWVVYRDVCNPLLKVDKCEIIEEDGWKGKWLKAIKREVPCTICKVFGYMGQRGRVRFTHAFPTSDELPIDIITRVAINRLTGAADPGKLFDLEAIPPGAVFYFFTIMENMSDEQKDLFEKGIRALNLQLAALGAHSNVGFGMVELEKVFSANIKPGIFDLDVEGIIKKILNNGKYMLRESLDEEKYPRFFLALSSWDKDEKNPPAEEFNNKVSYEEKPE